MSKMGHEGFIVNLTPFVPLSLRGRMKERGISFLRGAGAPLRRLLPFLWGGDRGDKNTRDTQKMILGGPGGNRYDRVSCYNTNDMCLKKFRTLRDDWLQFWHSDGNKPSDEPGVILPFLRWLFGRLEKLSYIRFKIFRMEKMSRPSKLRYKIVDWYNITWLIAEIVFFIILAFFHYSAYNIFFLIPFVFICYRLFDIFQSWVSQFVLGGIPQAGWKPISIYRSLVLVFLGYFEIIISYAYFALLFKGQFQGLECWHQALYYSIRNGITMGSDYHPLGVIGIIIFSTEVMFVILILTAVVNTIISHTKSSNSMN